MGGLGQFSRQASPSGLESDPYAAALNIVLGFCILRKNRLILPLMVIAVVLLILNIGLGFVRNDEATPVFVFGVFVWVLYAFYYYNRRHEFKALDFASPAGKNSSFRRHSAATIGKSVLLIDPTDLAGLPVHRPLPKP